MSSLRFPVLAALIAFLGAPLFAITWLEWRSLHFTATELADISIAGETADPDGDGSGNLLEYVLVTDPKRPDASSPITPTLIDGHMALSYRERTDLADAQVWLQGSENLAHWATYNTLFEAARLPGPEYDLVTLLDPDPFASASPHFWRLMVLLDPPPALAAPSSLVAEPISSSQVALRWTDLNADEVGYAVEQWDLVTGNWTRLAVLAADTTRVAVPAGSGLSYRVVALGADGQEAVSLIVTLPGPSGSTSVLALWDFTVATVGATTAIAATATDTKVTVSPLGSVAASGNANPNLRGVIESMLGTNRVDDAAQVPSGNFDGRAFEIGMRATNDGGSPSAGDYSLNFSIQVVPDHVIQLHALTLDFGYDTSATSGGSGNFVRPYLQAYYSRNGIDFIPVGGRLALPITQTDAFSGRSGHYIAVGQSVDFGGVIGAFGAETTMHLRLAFSDGGSSSDARAIFVDRIALQGTVAPATDVGRTTSPVLATKLLAEEQAIPWEAQAIRTLGYHEVGKGGGLYVYAGTRVPRYSPRGQTDIERPSSHYIRSGPDESGHRRYYVLAEENPNVLQFGAIAEGRPDGQDAHDNTGAFNDALSYGRGVFVPQGKYWIAGTLQILEDGSVLRGDGPGGTERGGSELYFGSGTADCIQAGDGVNLLRWAKITRLSIDARNRTGGNAIFAWFNHDLVLSELEIPHAYDGILLFRGLGFTVRDVNLTGIRAGQGTAERPAEIGYGLKLCGAAELYDQETGFMVKRDAAVLYLENISFSSAKSATDPTNWTVGLWCAENSASVNGSALRNERVRHGVYVSRAAAIDPADRLIVPEGYTVVPATRTEGGNTYAYGSPQYPSRPGTVVEANGRFQDLTLFFLGGDMLGAEHVYNEAGAGVAIHNPRFGGSYRGNCVYMGPAAEGMSIIGGEVTGAFAHGFAMHGQTWHISGVQIYEHSFDASNREAHRGSFSAIKVGATSVGGDIVHCKIGNEPPGTENRSDNTVQYGLDIDAGAKGTWYHGNRFDGCLEANVNNQAGQETQAGANYLGPLGS